MGGKTRSPAMCSQGFKSCHSWWLVRSRHRDQCRPVVAGFRVWLSEISSINCLHLRLDTTPISPRGDNSSAIRVASLDACSATRVVLLDVCSATHVVLLDVCSATHVALLDVCSSTHVALLDVVPYPGTGLSSNLRRGGRRPFASGTPAIEGRAQQLNIYAATGSSWLVWEPIPKRLTGTLSVDTLSDSASRPVCDFFSIECDLSQFAFALTVILANARIHRTQEPSVTRQRSMDSGSRLSLAGMTSLMINQSKAAALTDREEAGAFRR